MSKLMSYLSVLAIMFGSLAINAEAAPWQVWRTNSACGTAFACTVSLAVVPSGKRVEVESVSCLFERGGTDAVIESAVITLRNSAGALILRDNLAPTSFGGNYFAVNHQTKIFAPPGSRLAATIFVSKSSFLLIECKLAGQILP